MRPIQTQIWAFISKLTVEKYKLLGFDRKYIKIINRGPTRSLVAVAVK